jgi:adenosine/AMP kinase
MAATIEFEVVEVENPQNLNLIFGHSHFIKTVEDLYETLVQSSTVIKFGVAFCEASGARLVRFDGNDDALISLAKENGNYFPSQRN